MAAGFKIADAYVKVHTDFDQAAFERDVARGVERGGNSSSVRNSSRNTGRHVGRDIGGEVVKEVEKEVGRGGKSRGRTIAQRFAGDIAGPFGAAFAKSISVGFANSDLAGAFEKNPYVAAAGFTIGAALVTMVAGGVAATLTAALGGAFALGIVGLGAWILKSDPDVKKSATHLADTFKSVFTRSASALRLPLMGAMNMFADTLKKMQPVFDNIFYTIAPALMPLAEGISGFLINLGPGMEALAQVGASVLTDLGKNLPAWGKALGDFFINIRDNWPAIKKSLDEFFHDTGKVLGVIAGLFLWLAEHYELLRNIAIGVLFLPQVIAAAFVAAFTAIKNWVGARIDDIKGFFSKLKDHATTTMTSMKDGVTGAFQRMFDWVKTQWDGFTSWIGGILAAIGGVLKRGLDFLLGIWRSVWGFFGPTVMNVFGLIGDVIKLGMKATLFVIGAGIKAVQAIWNVAWNAIKSVVNAVWPPIKSAVTTSMNFIKNTVTTIWNAVSGFVSMVMGKIKGLIISGWNAIKGPIGAALGWVKTTVTNAWNSVVTTVRDKVSAMMGIVNSIRSKVTSALSSAGTWLLSAGKRIIQGLIDGINSKIDEVRGLLRRLTNMIPDWKGPAAVDKKLLSPNGRFLVQSLMDGVKDELPKFKMQMTGVTAGIPRAVPNRMPKSYMSTTNNKTVLDIDVNVNAIPGADGAKIGRDAAREIKKALDEYERSLPR